MAPDRIVAAARAHLDRPWIHQHADCRALITDVAAEFGVSYRGRTDYERAPDGVELLAECDAHLKRIPVADIRPGDVIVIQFAGKPHHIGFVGDYPHGGMLSLIHANSDIGKVVEHRLTREWRAKIVAAYRLPGRE